jgi:hypothetical protein
MPVEITMPSKLPQPGHFTSRGGCSRKASGHEAVLVVQPMARNAADAARSARPKGEYFSVSLCMFHAEVLVTNGAGWKSRTREFNPMVSFIQILILKNFQ